MSIIPIEGYASMFHVVDNQRDRVRPGAFQKTLLPGNPIPKMLWQHDVHQPVGRWIQLIEDQRGLYVVGELFLDLPRGRDAWVLIEKQVLDGFSIGFQAEKTTRCPKTGVRDLHQIKLIEISLVTFAAARPWTTIRHQHPIRDPTKAFPQQTVLKRLQDLTLSLQSSCTKDLNHVPYLPIDRDSAISFA